MEFASFIADIEPLDPRIVRYCLRHGRDQLSRRDVLEQLTAARSFRADFNQLLADSSFSAFRWETPALSQHSLDAPFEFVLLDTPGFASRSTDAMTFADYFAPDRSDAGIVIFNTLGNDARLIVPSPRGETAAYGHLAAFVRHAPDPQQDALWRVIGRTVLDSVSTTPIWLNTAGGGVAWLHVRLDSRPKYYGYRPYREVG